MNKREFSRRLRRLRKERDLTQQELAERAGLAKDWVWALENKGNILPMRATLQRLADALGVSVEELEGKHGRPK